jgi:hypothetical protein
MQAPLGLSLRKEEVVLCSTLCSGAFISTDNYLHLRTGDNRVCQIYDSPTLPESEAAFSIGTDGIENAKDV